jgi:hypothetical protein
MVLLAANCLLLYFIVLSIFNDVLILLTVIRTGFCWFSPGVRYAHHWLDGSF